MEVKIDSDKFKRVERYVEKGRFSSAEEFVDQAVKLLLYAEDNKDMFKKIVQQNE